jgi:DNA-directed RNA polymerase specialized sigma24 family protein
MERVLLGYRRTLETRKRGGGLARVPLAEALDLATESDTTTSLSGSAHDDRSRDDGAVLEILATALDVTEKIAELEKLDPPQAEIARLRYFIGLSIEETAEALGVSRRTVTRKWRNARRFLALELAGYDSG